MPSPNRAGQAESSMLVFSHAALAPKGQDQRQAGLAIRWMPSTSGLAQDPKFPQDDRRHPKKLDSLTELNQALTTVNARIPSDPQGLHTRLVKKGEKMLNKVIFVPSYFEPIGKTRTVKVPTGEVKVKKGLFGSYRETKIMAKEERWEQTGWSDCRIDGPRLAKDLQQAVVNLNQEGYEVVSVTSVASGNYRYQFDQRKGGLLAGGSGFGFGYGHSYTSGFTVVAKRVR